LKILLRRSLRLVWRRKQRRWCGGNIVRCKKRPVGDLKRPKYNNSKI